MSNLISTTATMNVDLTNEGNPEHIYRQEPRPALDPLRCANCDTESSIDGNLPIDQFTLHPGTEMEHVKPLCLGCVANARLVGFVARRV